METEKETCTRPKWVTKLLKCSNQGGILSQQLPAILLELNPGLNVDEKMLKRLIKQNDPDGSGVLDFDTVTKILFQLVLKQPSKEEEADALQEEMGKEVFLNLNSSLSNEEFSDCCCSIPGACKAMKITDFIVFPNF